MVKTANFFNSKCAEIFCQDRKQFSIICSFCNLKTLDYIIFLEHFNAIHKNVIEALLEVDQEVPMPVTFDTFNNQTVLENDDTGPLEFATLSENIEKCKISAPEDGEDSPNDSKDISVPGCPIDTEVLTYSENDFEFVKEDICEGDSSELRDCKVIKGRKPKELNKKLKCPICHIYKNNKYNLQSHINSHTGARPYNCQLCGKNFTNSGNLWKHMELVHRGIKDHECTKCSKKFQYRSQARRHEMRVHLKVRPYPCGVCENSYFTKKELAEHRIKHYSTESTVGGDVLDVAAVYLEMEQKKESKYICEHCGKSFSKYSGIWAHRRSHTDDKRYACNVCNKSMHTSYHLKEHMNTHTGERPHKCEVCGKAFQLKKLLRDHLRIHSDVKAFACKICSKRFSQAAGLYCHTKTHKEL